MATPVIAAQKTFPVYDHPSYTTRQSLQFGKVTGNAATAKLVAYSNMWLYSCSVFVDTAGTSTFSSTISAQTLQLTVIVNTNTTGTAIGLTTTTWGPYAMGGLPISTSTGTGIAGGFVQFALNTTTGVAGSGGYYVPAGSEMTVTLGADATAVLVPAIDYQLAPLAPVPA
jgi:hypothetical protein